MLLQLFRWQSQPLLLLNYIGSQLDARSWVAFYCWWYRYY
jgi:hypothetical protein